MSEDTKQSGGNAPSLFPPLPAGSPQLYWDILFDGRLSVCCSDMEQLGKPFIADHGGENLPLFLPEKKYFLEKCGNCCRTCRCY